MKFNLILVLLIILISLIITKNSINIEHFYVVANELDSEQETNLNTYVSGLESNSCSTNVQDTLDSIFKITKNNNENIISYYDKKKKIIPTFEDIKIDFENNNKCESLIKMKPLLVQQNEQIENEINEINAVIVDLQDLLKNYIGQSLNTNNIDNKILTELNDFLNKINNVKDDINTQISGKIDNIDGIIDNLGLLEGERIGNFTNLTENINDIKENLLENKDYFDSSINYINNKDSSFKTLRLYDNTLSDKINDSYMGSNIKEVCLEDGPNSNDLEGICKNEDWGCKISCQYLNKNEIGGLECNLGSGINYDMYTNIFGEELKVHSHIHVHPGPHPHNIPSDLQENN